MPIVLGAKLPIPLVIYEHPVPWLFAVVAAVAIYVILQRLYDGGTIDPALGIPAVVFVYAGYHMVGGMLHGFDLFFGLGFLGAAGSAAYAFVVVRGFQREHVDLEPPELKRQRALESVVETLGCTSAQASELLDRFEGDDVKAILEVRSGRTPLPGTTGEAAPAPTTVAVPTSDEGPPVARIEGTPFDPVKGFMLLQATPGPKDFARLGKLLASITTLNAIDAVQKLRAHRGAVILPDLKEEVADAFIELLRREGMAVLKMPVSQRLTFAYCGEVKTLAYENDALVVTNHTDDVIRVPWDQMLLLSVALFGASGAADPDGYVDIRKGLPCADLFVLIDKQCFQIAIDSKRLTFAHLGDRMESTGLANFRLTVADIAERAPNLMINDSAKALIEKGAARPYRAPEDFAGESTGLLQLIQATRLLKSP